jgi:hypothetical protein
VTLIDSLIAGTTQQPSVVSALRLVQLLAAQVRSADLADWADRELSGYDLRNQVPSYRGSFDSEVYVRYRLTRYGLSDLADVMWPLRRERFLDEVWQSGARQLYEVCFTEPIAQLEDLSQGTGTLVRPWSSGLIDAVNGLINMGAVSIEADYTVAEAENRFSSALAVKVVTAVRRRILDLAVGLERHAPCAGEENGPSKVSPAMQEIIDNCVR